MARQQAPSAEGTTRRSALRLLGAVPVAASGMLASAPAAHAEPAPTPSGARLERLKAYGKFIAQLASEDKFSGVVHVAYRGRPVLSNAYGMADKERSIPNRTDTTFALASASKPFTGLSIVHLAQQQKLKFHDTVGTHLEGYPDDVAKTVTIHQLLTHTSGLGPAPFGLDTITYSVEEQWELLTRSLRKARLEFTPGTKHAYSSSGMDLLGEIVAKVSGQTFWSYVRENIFEPAGMRRSDYYTRTQWLSDPKIAHPYMLQSDGSRIDAVRHLEAGAVLGGPGSNSARGFIGSGGGNGFSTAPDLVRFATALRSNQLLDLPWTELYVGAKFPVTPSPGAPPDPSRQGAFSAYTLTHSFFNGRRVIGHGGGIGGGNTNWSIYLDMDWTAVILCNYDLESFQPIIDRERHAITDS